MREKLPAHGFPRAALREAFLPVFAEMKDKFLAEHQRFQQEWNEKVPRMRMCRNYAYAKSDIWSYEKEWRLYDLAQEGPPFFEDTALKDGEVAAVYLGCRMSDVDKASIIEVARHRHPGAAIFQASKATLKYALQFTKLE